MAKNMGENKNHGEFDENWGKKKNSSREGLLHDSWGRGGMDASAQQLTCHN
jgi:hypothetical protein